MAFLLLLVYLSAVTCISEERNFGPCWCKDILTLVLPRCAMVFGGVVSSDGLGLGRIGAPGYGAHRSVAMAPMFKGIRFGRHHFCSEV